MAKRIAVAGKGGTGKTTLAALCVEYLCSTKEGPVLALDADPDANLGSLLGVKVEKTVGDLREEIRREMSNLPAGMSKAEYVEAGLHQIVVEATGFDLIAMGRGEGAGCYCSLNNLIRKFSDDLLPSYTWVVMDNEAGLEHLSRRTSGEIDALLVVVNENPISFETARRILALQSELKGRPSRAYLVANMVHPEREDRIRKRLEELDGEIAGIVTSDAALEELAFDRRPLKELEKSTAKEQVFSIIEKIRGNLCKSQK